MGISYCKIERGFAERKLPFSHDFLLDVSIDDALDISCIPEHCRSITYSVKDVGKCFMHASTHFCWIDPNLASVFSSSSARWMEDTSIFLR